jgi:hypothetical protein
LLQTTFGSDGNGLGVFRRSNGGIGHDGSDPGYAATVTWFGGEHPVTIVAMANGDVGDALATLVDQVKASLG